MNRDGRLLARILQWYRQDLGGARSANYQNLYETEFSTNGLLIDAKAVQ